MGKTPSRSRKQVKARAPYRRSKKSEPAEATPPPAPARVPLPQVPATSEVSPTPELAAVPVPVPEPVISRPMAATPPAPAPIAIIPPAPPVPPVIEPPTPAPLAAAAWGSATDLLAVMRTSLGACEAALTALPHPSEIVAGDPTTPEPPPGLVPPGDSRSLRSGDRFALVYRHGPALVTRIGTIGQRGEWRVVTYPNPARAASAYASECSRLHLMGFTDLG